MLRSTGKLIWYYYPQKNFKIETKTPKIRRNMRKKYLSFHLQTQKFLIFDTLTYKNIENQNIKEIGENVKTFKNFINVNVGMLTRS